MGAMTASHAAIPTGRPFTAADLEAMPDDGDRYELIDGMLILSRHRAGARLLDRLRP